MKRSISLFLALLTVLLLLVPASAAGEGEESCTEPGHSYGTDFVVDVEPTCKSEGSKSRHCTRCGEKTDITPIPQTAHTYGNWGIKKAATCVVAGIEAQNCTYCGFETTRVIRASGVHNIVIDKNVEPTCTKPGLTEGSHCSLCNEVFKKQESIPATGHTTVDDPAIEPTCTKAGKTAGSHCATCGTVFVAQKTIAYPGHKTVIDEFVDSTCTQEGRTRGSHCSVCGEVFAAQNVILKKEHVYEDTLVKKSCTQDGYTLHTCKICGDEYRTDFDYAVGHRVVSDGKNIPETCTTDGLLAKTYCSVCSKVIDEPEVLKAKGHQWKTKLTGATTKKDGRSLKACSVCGITAPGGDVKIARIASIKLSKTTYAYDGKAKKPTVVVKDSTGKVLTAKKDYTVSYDSGRKKVGTYYVSITFKGNYSGRKVLKFRVALSKPTGIKGTASSKAATVSWNKVKNARSYVVYYSTSKNGEYKKAGTTTKLSFTLGKLQSAKTYYFKVRAVTKAIDGSNSYGYYSARVRVKVR